MCWVGALILLFGGMALNVEAQSTKIIYTIDYQHNLAMRDPFTQRWLRVSLPHAMGYVNGQREESSQQVYLINYRHKPPRRYTFCAQFVAELTQVDSLCGYCTPESLPQNLRMRLEQCGIRDSLAQLSADPTALRMLLVADVTDQTVRIRRVDVTDYTADKQAATALQSVADRCAQFIDTTLYHYSQRVRSRDVLAAEGDFAAPFQAWQLAVSGADVSFFAAADLTLTTDRLTPREVLRAWPFCDSLAVIEVSGEQLQQIVERACAKIYRQINSEQEDLVRLRRTPDGRWGTITAPHNLECIAGISYTVDLSRRKRRVCIDSLADGRLFSPQARYRIVTTLFRAARICSHYPPTSSTLQVVSTDCRRDFVTYLLRSTHQPKSPYSRVDFAPFKGIKARLLQLIDDLSNEDYST